MSDTATAAPASDATPAVPTDPATIAARDAELTALYESDPNTYSYAEGGRFATEHLALRKAQQPKAVEQAAGDDLADEDVSAIDLDAAGAEDEAGEAEGDEATIKPLGLGDDATDEELAAWRVEHGVPDEPDGYEPPTVAGITWDADALGQINEIAHRHNVPQQAMADALAAYAEQIKAKESAIKQRDAENAKAVRSTFSEAEIAAVKSAAKAMPAELRTMLNTARLPDGTRLVNQPEVLRLIAAGYGDLMGEGQHTPQAKDSTTAMQQELRDLDHLMRTSIDDYHREWRGTGLSGSDRRLQIMRELGSEGPAKPSAADIRAEEQELVRLSQTDPALFSHGSWPGARSPADRLHAIRAGRG